MRSKYSTVKVLLPFHLIYVQTYEHLQDNEKAGGTGANGEQRVAALQIDD